MAEQNRTLYEVLGVSSNAKATDITRAYNRILDDQKKETSAPNPRLVAQAKVAYDTLRDPDKRDEYDALLRRRLVTGQSARKKPYLVGAAVVAALAIVG
ncbi:MAG TPA: DnaJ domain-containing protein, partial [Usitatibacter sp.]|nr:DnaJ domain-containing protein [Usitatibacter sp.]